MNDGSIYTGNTVERDASIRASGRSTIPPGRTPTPTAARRAPTLGLAGLDATGSRRCRG